MGSIPDRSTLVRLYHDEGKSMSDIADEYGVGTSTVNRWLKSHNIETRDRGSTAPANTDEGIDLLDDEEWLKSKLYDEIVHPDEIADEVGCSTTTVRRRMDKHDLPIIYKDENALRRAVRDRYLTPDEIADSLGRSKRTIIRWANEMGVKYRPWQYEKTLQELRERGLSTYEIADELGCSSVTIVNWMEKFGMDTSSVNTYTNDELLDQIEETYREHGFISKRLFEYKDNTASVSAVRDHFGSWSNAVEKADIDETARHPTNGNQVPDNYRQSHGRNRSTLYKRKRQEALERDDYQCQICGATAEDDELHTHHINPMNDFDDQSNAHTLDNLITLCKEHHRQVEADEIECPDPPES